MRHASHASHATVRSRRVAREVVALRARFGLVEVAGDATWVKVDHVPLSGAWAPSCAPVLILVPPNYPEAAPDGAFVGARLGHDSATPALRRHVFATVRNPLRANGYVWCCLEDHDGHWDWRLDSLSTFVDALLTHVGGGSCTCTSQGSSVPTAPPAIETGQETEHKEG